MRKLYVSNLQWGIDSEALREAFSQYGNVVKAQVVTDRDTGRSRGFGFVEFDSQAEAEDAIRGMNERELKGRPIRVEMAKPRN